MLPPEPEILAARRSFGEAQTLLTGAISLRASGIFTCGWYGSALHPDRGCYAVISSTGALSDLVGDRLRLTYKYKGVLVYAFASADLEHDVEITRRAFMAIAPLALEDINVLVEVQSG